MIEDMGRQIDSAYMAGCARDTLIVRIGPKEADVFGGDFMVYNRFLDTYMDHRADAALSDGFDELPLDRLVAIRQQMREAYLAECRAAPSTPPEGEFLYDLGICIFEAWIQNFTGSDTLIVSARHRYEGKMYDSTHYLAYDPAQDAYVNNREVTRFWCDQINEHSDPISLADVVKSRQELREQFLAGDTELNVSCHLIGLWPQRPNKAGGPSRG